MGTLCAYYHQKLWMLRWRWKWWEGSTYLGQNRTTYIISCIPHSTRLHPYPSLIQKMKTYLEFEGKLGPKPRPQSQTQSEPHTSTPSHNNNPLTRKNPRTQNGRKEEPEYLQKEVTYHPNNICTYESNPYPHGNHFYYIHPNSHS